MTAYYNERDRQKAAWLRELIRADLIAPGDVDERDIKDVFPNDLAGYIQYHFFAGIGVWSYALRLAGWPDDRPVWTGSCPCQPFSAAGGRKGTADERHLWPAFFHLIEVCRPVTVFGEQVASKDGLAWLDLVQADLEGTGYACGPVDSCAAGFGAPHIRQRLYFAAERLEHDSRHGWIERWAEPSERSLAGGCSESWLAHSNVGNASSKGIQRGRQHGQQPQDSGSAERMANDSGERLSQRERDGRIQQEALESSKRQATDGGSNSCRMANLHGETCGGRGVQRPGESSEACSWPACERPAGLHEDYNPSPTNGFWRDVDWLHCRDEKWRPVEPATFPLAYGSPARVGRLRGYGDAIVAPQAAAFVQTYLEHRS